jgi:asparagine synthetase B (glutamine-hydrolysing)
MCGICGVWNYKNCDPVNRDLLKSMTDRMIYRGPDDRGLYFDYAAGIGLGFRRLAIIDLSPVARQPMSDEFRPGAQASIPHIAQSCKGISRTGYLRAIYFYNYTSAL